MFELLPNVSQQMCKTENFLTYTITTDILWGVSHHMCDSGESDNLSVCHTTNETSPSICQSHQTSVCHIIKMTCLSICQSSQTSVCHTIKMASTSICQSHDTSVHHTNIMTSMSICQSPIPLPVILSRRLFHPYVCHINCLTIIPST